MTTYEDNGFRYFWDTHIKMWTIYQIDSEGNQISRAAEHYGYREQLLLNHPGLKFTKLSKS